MTRDLPSYRKWLVFPILGVAFLGFFSPFSHGVDKILEFVWLASLLAWVGLIFWEERRLRQAGGSNAATSSSRD